MNLITIFVRNTLIFFQVVSLFDVILSVWLLYWVGLDYIVRSGLVRYLVGRFIDGWVVSLKILYNIYLSPHICRGNRTQTPVNVSHLPPQNNFFHKLYIIKPFHYLKAA